VTQVARSGARERSVARRGDDQERLVAQRADEIQPPSRRVGQHDLGRLHVEAATKEREHGEREALLLVEERPRPLERSEQGRVAVAQEREATERSVAGRRHRARARFVQTIGDAFAQAARTQQGRPLRRELDREWEPVEQLQQRHHVVALFRDVVAGFGPPTQLGPEREGFSVLARTRQRERRHLDRPLAFDVQSLSRRREDLEIWTRDDPLAHGRADADEVLEVFEHQKTGGARL
jgi:hypothetical protein